MKSTPNTMCLPTHVSRRISGSRQKTSRSAPAFKISSRVFSGIFMPRTARPSPRTCNSSASSIARILRTFHERSTPSRARKPAASSRAAYRACMTAATLSQSVFSPSSRFELFARKEDLFITFSRPMHGPFPPNASTAALTGSCFSRGLYLFIW